MVYCKFITFLTCICALSFLPAPAQSRKELQKENEMLKKENSALMLQCDSLAGVIALYRDALASSDEDGSSPENDNDYWSADSLARTWILSSVDLPPVELDVDSVRFSSDVGDEVFIDRLQKINSLIPLSYNQYVKNCCIMYSERMPDAMGRILGLAEYYRPLADEILTRYELPLELKALVIVESMYNPRATSRVGAKGLWQFMYGTARGYGLRIDSFTDERADPYKSTVAAARYLKDAYALFKDWPLAIASYNCGTAGILKAIRRSGGKRDFWQIYEYLPRETRRYFPAFIGALYATHYYKEYGIVPRRDAALRLPVDTVVISRNVHFSQIEEVVGISGTTLKALNPQYMHEIVPGDSYPCTLRLPLESVGAFIDAGDSVYVHKREFYLNPVQLKKIEDGITMDGKKCVYRVKQGDVLGWIARRYGVSVSQIKKWNGLRSDTIRVGQNLIVYVKK